MNYENRITIEPGKRGGKPCIRGLRITVYDVLECLASGMTQEEILDDFPELERDDLLACLSFAEDRERHLQTGGLTPEDAEDIRDAEQALHEKGGVTLAAAKAEYGL